MLKDEKEEEGKEKIDKVCAEWVEKKVWMKEWVLIEIYGRKPITATPNNIELEKLFALIKEQVS